MNRRWEITHKTSMPLKITIALVCLLLAAGAAVWSGLFDSRTMTPVTRPFVEAPAPTIDIAPLDEALTFARLDDGANLAVLSYEDGRIIGAPLAGDEDAIGLLARLGYDGVKKLIEDNGARLTIDATRLATPVDLRDRHIAAGANYSDHADEADVEGGPFLFPKYVAPTAARSAVIADDALLDYEVELCLVAITGLAPDAPASGGLVLCNDFTDRAALLRHIDRDNPRSG